jgi:hypothetical protein
VFNKKIIFAFLVLLLFYTSSFAIGMKVSPGSFCVSNLAVGKDHNLGVDLTITNKDDFEQEYTIKTVVLDEKKDTWIKGYSQIPDPSWFYFDKDKVKIKAGGEEKVRMHVKIPDQEKYLNQHWIVFVEVTAKPEKGAMFNLSLRPSYLIETQAKEDIEQAPHGVLAVAPNVVMADDITLGEEERVSFTIYNNDQVDHKYSVTTYIPDTSSQKLEISLSPGFVWIEDLGWVRPLDSNVEIKAGRSGQVNLEILVPNGTEYDENGWEGIIMIEPDDNNSLSGFARILIEPKKEVRPIE